MTAFYKSRTQITKEFSVSEGTIRNWLKKAIKKELDIDLHHQDGKVYIINSEKNKNVLKNLAKLGKKHRPNKNLVTVTVPDEFYEVFNQKQALNIINTLESELQIHGKYMYLGEGANYWNAINQQALEDNSYKTFNQTKEFLNRLSDIIFNISESKINIIDAGCGNGDVVNNTIKKLYNLGILNKYIAVDISPEILTDNKKTLLEIIPESMYQSYVLDYETNSLKDVIFEWKYNQGIAMPTYVLFLGGSITNTKNYIHTIFNLKDGLDNTDKLIISNSFTNENKAILFNLLSNQFAYKFATWIPRLLGLSSDLTDDLCIVNSKDNFKEFHLELLNDTQLQFSKINRIVNLYSGSKVCCSLHRPDTVKTILQLIEQTNLNLDLFIKNPESNYTIYILGRE